MQQLKNQLKPKSRELMKGWDAAHVGGIASGMDRLLARKTTFGGSDEPFKFIKHRACSA